MEWSGGLWRGGSDAVGRAAIGASERPVAAGFGSASFKRKTRKEGNEKRKVVGEGNVYIWQ